MDSLRDRGPSKQLSARGRALASPRRLVRIGGLAHTPLKLSIIVRGHQPTAISDSRRSAADAGADARDAKASRFDVANAESLDERWHHEARRSSKEIRKSNAV